MATTPKLVKVANGVEAQLSTKVAALNTDQSWDRLTEIANSGDTSDVTLLEAAKLFFGPDATLSE